ncbi:MAG: NADH-quinone oxidoreductase subunit L, partial [Acidocella sp. 21-58-7]
MLTTIAVFAPLVGAVLSGLFRPLLGKQLSIASSILFMGLSAAAGVMDFAQAVQGGATLPPLHIATWISVGSFTPDWTLRQDMLSLVMVGMVSFVSALIHVYSAGYMAHDKGYGRFFSYLNLFCFAMLVLVLADNLLLMFVGWEGVGLCSYLLIGFWFDHKPNAVAGMKAFIVNRIGDFGFLIGLMILLWGFYAVG